MHFRKNILQFFSLIVIILSTSTTAQVVFRKLPNYQPYLQDRSFFGITKTREVILLNGEWKVFPAEEKVEKKVSVLSGAFFNAASVGAEGLSSSSLKTFLFSTG